MERLHIEGGHFPKGRIVIGGAKNAALPIIIASLLSKQTITLQNVPRLDDIAVIEQVLSKMGVENNYSEASETVEINTSGLRHVDIDSLSILKSMRAGILMLGPLGYRLGKVTLPLPGGDPIGKRPIGLHLDGLEKMGATIERHSNAVSIEVKSGLAAIDYEFPRISVGATEALIMSACLAKGTTRLQNIAIEPEILNLIDMLRTMGATIYQEGHRRLIIKGNDDLLDKGASHRIIEDRIECGSYAMAFAACHEADILLVGGSCELLGQTVVSALSEMGVMLNQSADGLKVELDKGGLKGLNILTAPWPGFATDLQAQLTVLCTQARGLSSIEETVFEDRFQQIKSLCSMGAIIEQQGNRAIIQGPCKLQATDNVVANDIRASFSLVIAAIIANGNTTIIDNGHLKRGYENIDKKLSNVGVPARWSK